MTVARFKELIKRLETVPEGRFCMSSWSRDCGTVCCAAGWACYHPEFNVQGLHWLRDPRIPGPLLGFLIEPTYGGMKGQSAIVAFFHCTDEQFDSIFMPHCYSPLWEITPKMVIDRILMWLEEEEDART